MKTLLIFLLLTFSLFSQNLIDFLPERGLVKIFSTNNSKKEKVLFNQYIDNNQLKIFDFSKDSKKIKLLTFNQEQIEMVGQTYVEDNSKEVVIPNKFRKKILLKEPILSGYGWENNGYFYEILSENTTIHVGDKFYEGLILRIDTGYETKIIEYYVKGLGIVKKEVYFGNRLINKEEMQAVYKNIEDIDTFEGISEILN